MHIVTKKAFNSAAVKYPNNKAALLDMFQVLRSTNFNTPEELKALYPSLDNFKYKDKWWVLDVGGNELRVILFIQFVNRRMYIKHIVNHADYDKLSKKYRKEPK